MTTSTSPTFKDLGLTPKMIEVLEKENYKVPYPIQDQSIPAILSGKDILGIAKTGSGKTAAYVLPILTWLEKNRGSKNRHIDVLILVPTRELAVQVEEVVSIFNLGLNLPIKSKAVFGGVSINPQMIGMQGVNLLVATPGRLIELMENKALSLSSVKTFVLDEADKLLNLGFKEEVDLIISRLPEKRQNLLFSATLSKVIGDIKQILLNDPLVISIEEEKESHIEQINQAGYLVTEERKGPLLRYLIKSNDLQQVLVFTSSVHNADKLETKLNNNGIQAVAMHSKKSHFARTDALSRFKAGQLRVLIATDLLSRGIDIEFLPCVINYELPRSPKDYIHRIGRTGRAEASGDAISFVTENDRHHFKVIQKKTGTWVTLTESDDLDLHGF